MIHIVVPLYNGIEFLDECIRAIQHQSIKHWKLHIAVNRQTSPESEIYTRALEYSKNDLRIRVLDLYFLKGKPNTLNYMIKYGIPSLSLEDDWIALCDVDDIWHPTKLESQVPYMEKYDVIGTRCQYFGDSENIPNIPTGDLSQFTFYDYNPIINSSSLVRAKLCIWEDTPLEDYTLWLSLWKRNCMFYNVPTIEVKHRVHANSEFNAKGNDVYVQPTIDKFKSPKITFATSWFVIKSKIEHSQYMMWMKHILGHVKNFYLVVYTDNASEEMLSTLVGNNTSVQIVVKEWDDFYCYRWYSYWLQNHKNNNCLNDNSPFHTDWRLNMLWSEKINFVNDSMSYFHTDFYGWMDIGYFRDSPIQKEWPCEKTILDLDRNKIYYAQVCDDDIMESLCRSTSTLGENGMPIVPISQDQMSIAGGFFIAHKTKIMWWYSTYYTRLQMYFENKYLVKDDQMIILDCISNYRDHFELIISRGGEQYSPYRWFGFQSFLSNKYK